MALTWINKAIVGKIARMFDQAIAEPIFSSIQPMGENIQVVLGVALIPDAHFSAWKGMMNLRICVLFLLQRFCEAHKALFM